MYCGPEIKIIDKHPIREFSALACDGGVVLCAKDRGSFITLRYKEDLEALRNLLNRITITTSFNPGQDVDADKVSDN